MSFGGRTPESLLPRSDSKNPSTTCKGITTNGRPCRRSLAQSRQNSPKTSYGILAVLDGRNRDHVSAAAFYCWQHKDQAEQILDEKRTTILDLTEETGERGSIDMLVDRLGVLDLDGDIKNNEKKKISRSRRKNNSHVKQRDTMPAGWHDMQSPLMTVPEEVVRVRSTKKIQEHYGRSNVKASFLCCVRAVEEEDLPPVRRRRDEATDTRTAHAQLMKTSPTSGSRAPPCRIPSSTTYNNEPTDNTMGTYHNLTTTTPRPSLSTPPHSQTQTFLSLIPPHLPPTTTSTLLNELSKPISRHDEPGYIYIFWLTPDTTSKPDDDAASSLLDYNDDTPTSRPSNGRRQSDLLHKYASASSKATNSTILLKVGRASNVHRRLTQWSQQCGHNITLLRFYPTPSPAQKQPSTPRPVPHVSRVERLIHLELAGRKVKQDRCAACGREHREWFEVDASRRGLKEVHEVVERWVRWAETTSGGGER